MRNAIDQCGGRKFLLCLGCGIVTALLTATGKIDGAIYATVVLGTIGAYIVGNTTQKIKAPGASNAA